jgi:uncharacterized protein YndB with AHSA1/START domain
MMNMTRRIGMAAVAVALAASASAPRAEVLDSSAGGFTVKNTVTIAATPEDAYRQLTTKVGQWWNPEHTYSGESQNLSIDAWAGGCFCEKLPVQGSVRHMVVVFASPGKMLRMTGGLGPLQGLAVSGSLTFQLTAVDKVTKVEMSYTVGGYRPGGLQDLAPVVDGMLREQLERLKNYIEKGRAQG